MTNYIILYLAYFIEGLITYFYFNSNYNAKFKPYVTMLSVQGLYLLSFLPNVILHNNNVLVNTSFFTISTFLFAILCFEISTKSSIFHSVILLVIMTATEMVTELAVEFAFGRTLFVLDNKILNLFIGLMISKSLYFIIVYFIATTLSYKKNNAVGSMSKSYLNMFYPFIVFILLILIFRIILEYSLSRNMLILTMILSGAAIVLCCFTAIYNQRIQKRENELAELEKQQMKNEIDMQYLGLLEVKNREMQILTHDYKNHLAVIRNMSSEQVADYIDKMTDEIKTSNTVCQSGNHTFDIIINKYLTECAAKGIDFSINVKLSNLSFVDSYDLVTILGNALDNALEAAEKSKGKKIYLSTKRVNTYDSVIIENSCDIPPDSKLKTTKINKSSHGLGMKSISKTLKKYGGDFEWEYNQVDKIFKLTIILMRKEA